MVLQSRNRTGNRVTEGGPQLPEAPQSYVRSLANRLAIALKIGKPDAKDLADNKFIRVVKKA